MTRPVEALLSTDERPVGSGIVVSPHYLASRAGADILRAGGTGVDAAIAADAVLAVVAPDTCGPGGDLFALLHRPGHEAPLALNASGRAGSGVSADQLRDMGLGEIPYRSPWSITVPGCVDGWLALSSELGRLPLATVLHPAVTLARGGFPVSAELASSLERIEDLVGSQASAAALYPAGSPPSAGSTITRNALADVLEAVSSSGRSGFYEGDVAAGITESSRGAVTPDDLSRPQADWIDPISLDVFGRTAWTIPPNSQGYLTLATLSIFEMLDPPTDPNDPAFHHLLIEAYRAVAWERADTVGDPTTASVTTEELLDRRRLEDRATAIAEDAVTRWPIPTPAPGGTAYLTVLDPKGVGVSFIQSNYAGIGAGLSAGSTGVWLHNRGAGFNLIPGHANEYAPGKRPLHTLSPTLWTKDGALDLLLGTRGGDQQPQFLAQFAATHFHASMCTDDSQNAPRWSMDQPMPGVDSQLRVESRFAAGTVEGLRSRGHVVDLANDHEPGWGPISAIDVGMVVKGSADPRVSTSSAVAV